MTALEFKFKLIIAAQAARVTVPVQCAPVTVVAPCYYRPCLWRQLPKLEPCPALTRSSPGACGRGTSVSPMAGNNSDSHYIIRVGRD